MSRSPITATPAAGIQEALANLYKLEYGPNSPEEAAITKAVRERGTFAPDVIDKGTLAFGLTFPNGFKVVVLDSAGPITDGDRALAQKLGRVDVAIIGYQAHAVGERQAGETFPLVKLFNPRLYLPEPSRRELRKLARSRPRAAVRAHPRRDAGDAIPGAALPQPDLRRDQRREAGPGGEVPILDFVTERVAAFSVVPAKATRKPGRREK